MTTTLTRLALAPEAAPEQFDAWARARGWALALDLPRGHGLISERVFKPAGEGDVAVGWCEEHTLGVRFAWVRGDAALAAELGAALPHRGRADLLARASGDDLGEALDAMRALAVLEAGSPPSAEFVALFERLAAHESAVVRRVALHLGWVGGWRELAPLAARRCDDDATLAASWTKLATALRKVGAGA